MDKKYITRFEVASHAAMFTRPDTGAAPISYPVPTWSACKAMFEAVARGFFSNGNNPAAFFCPTEVRVGRPVRMEKYVTNYRGPLRKSSQMAKESSYQLPATILVDVCYQIEGVCLRIPGVPDNSNNAPHALMEMFERRLLQGKNKYAPCLGWKEFIPTYFGSLREEGDFILQEDYNVDVPALLMSVWDSPSFGRYSPRFANCVVEKGVLKFPEVEVINGKLVFKGMK